MRPRPRPGHEHASPAATSTGQSCARKHMDAQVPVAWLESNEPSYILYTSGTTGKPKGVQRDTGGYAVALAASMKHIYCGDAGETMFTTSDIGWVVGPFLHHLRAADRRHDDDHVRGHADPSRRRHLVEDRAGLQGDGDVLGADRDPRAEEAGSGVPEEVRPVEPAGICSSPASRSTSRPTLDLRGAGQAGDRPLLADRDRLADPHRRARAWSRRRSSSAARRSRRTATTCSCCARRTRPSAVADEKGVVGDRAAAAAGVHDDGVGRRRALRQHLFLDVQGRSWSTRPSTGASATRTATTSSSGAPTT